MKNKFVADGPDRFMRAKKDLPTSEQIGQKYATRLATASSAEKEKIQEQMVEEYLRIEKIRNHKPSPATLW
jgi:hypothetical protein